jgi:hypothetical protein
MSSSIPSPEDFIASFPNPVAKIEGPPTYESLTELRNTLKANAATVASHRGGGSNGYLGLVVSAAVYATIDPTAFTLPDNPGPQPVIPPGTTAAQVGALVRTHTAHLREWREYMNIHQALKTLLINAIDPIYLRARRHRHVGFNNITLPEILSFLFTSYGRLTPQDLQASHTSMLTAWDPNMPFETVIDQIEDAVDTADAGGQPFTNPQIINAAYTIVFNTGMYFDDCKTWNRRPVGDQTWPIFKAHFLEAQREVRLQQQTTQQAGFHANYMQVHEFDAGASEALANLATATAADRQAFAAMVTTNATLTEQLSTALARLRILEAQVAQLNAFPRAPPTLSPQPAPYHPLPTAAPAVPAQPRPKSYCWTHGYAVAKTHTSATCERPADGHKRNATPANNLGGSQVGKPTRT